MAIDGLIMYALTNECQTLVGGRINKIYQPNETEIVLHIRTKGVTKRLLLSAHPVYARFHFTESQYENPLEPPMFCMLLRKHLNGGIITKFHQLGLERIVHLDVETTDELGSRSIRRLVIEIMGRHSNIILIDPEQNRILDGIRRVTPSISQHRQVFPGAPYVTPPDQQKADPFSLDEETFVQLIDFNQGRLDKQIVAQFYGIGPLHAKEIVHRAGLGSRNTYWNSFSQLIDALKNNTYAPYIVHDDKKQYLSVIRLTHVQGEERPFTSMHSAVSTFYEGKAERDAVMNRIHDLTRFVQNTLKKNEKKLKLLERELEKAERADNYRLYGELLTANMYQVKRGDTQIEVVNYYDPSGQTVIIPLDPQLSPADNAQQYFKRYQKAKASYEHITEQMKKTKEEYDYFTLILQQLKTAALEDIDDIRAELEQEGFIRKQRTRPDSRQKHNKRTLTMYISSEGIPIYVGRNNRQNEFLTHRFANRTDTWLHAKDLPGSHVIIHSSSYGEDTLHEAAQIAAYYSKGRDSSQVPIDYTIVKHVRKPRGAKPGFVIYDYQKTLYVTPDESLVQKLSVKRVNK